MKNLLLTGICFVLFACGGQDSQHLCLDAAEDVMADHPDSALSLLRGIEPSTLRSARLRARRALLYAEALDKSGVNVDDDSLIRIAVAYFRNRGEDEQRAKAYYYLARVYENNHELDTAVKSLVRAEEFVARSENNYLHGLISESFGRLYLSQYHLPEARNYYEQAIAFYNDCGVKLNEGLCYRQMARINAFEKKFEDSAQAYQHAIEIFSELKDTLNLLKTSGVIAGLRLRTTHDAQSVKQMLRNNYLRFNRGRMPETDYYLWSALHINSGELDSARVYALKSLKLSGDTDVRMPSLFLLKDIEKISGRYKIASDYYEKYIKCIDSVYVAEQEQQIQRLERRYKNELLRAYNEKLRQRNIYTIVTGILSFIILLFASGALLRQRRKIIKRQRLRLTHYSKFIESLKDNYDGMKAKYEALALQHDQQDKVSSRILSSFKNRLEGLKLLIDNAYLYERKPAQFFEEFKKYVIINPNTQYAFSDIQYVVNKTCFGVIDHLKENYPDLSPFDLDLCSLLCFGFTQNGIRMIYEHKNTYSIYNKRSKLRKKLGLQSSEHIETFLKSLVEKLEKEQRRDSE